uniref:SANTA domain-containing protein n=1 Tax=Plectus sambesii TaxID=2011161 RepID=A0A914WH33_9BILA
MAHRSRFLDYSPRMSMQSTEIKLKLWVFKIVFGQFEVCVEGYRPKDRDETELKCWHSTAIADRLTSSMLQTKSGSTYTLHGPMDTDAAQIYGYPDYLIEAFKDGFPPNWRELLTDFHTMLVRSSQCDISQWFNSSLMAERRRSSMNVSRRQSAIFPSLTEAVNKYSRDKQLVPVGRRSFRSRQSFVIPASAPMTPVAEDRSAERDPEELVVNHTDGSPLAAVPRTSPLTAVRKSPRLSSVPPAEQIIEVAQNDEEQIAEVASPSPSPTKIGP